MKDSIAQDVYDTLTGSLLPEYMLPWVENAFATGEPCEVLLGDAYNAYDRLRDRLGVADEDRDVEIIFDAFLEMERILCLKMFEYGVRYGQQNQPRP